MKRQQYWLVILFLFFISSQLPIYEPLLSDENHYFYLGKLVSEGSMPYSDFFFAHPPVQLFVFAGLIKVFGYSFALLKSVALFSTLISAFIIYLFVRERDETFAVVLTASFLFSQTIFYMASVNMGINLTTAMVLGGVYLLHKSHNVSGGLLFGLACFTGLYAVVPVGMALVYLLLNRNWLRFRKVAAGFVFSTGLMLASIASYASVEFFNQVIKYHSIKPLMGFSGRFAMLSLAVVIDNVIWLPFVIGLLISLYAMKDKIPSYYLLTSLALLVFIISLNHPLRYYMVLLYPFAILTSGQLLNGKSPIVILSITILVIGSGLGIANGITDYKEEYSYNNFDKLKQYVSQQEGSLFGDFAPTSLLALETGKEYVVTKNVDTYPMTQSVIDLDSFIVDLRKAKPKIIVLHEIGGTINPLWKIAKIRYELDCLKEMPSLEYTYENNGIRVYLC